MRLSQMQTRLIATLDELDASRAAHQREMKAERRAKERLSEKLDRYVDEIKRAEAERDEMREVVSILVDKGASRVLRDVLHLRALVSHICYISSMRTCTGHLSVRRFGTSWYRSASARARAP